MNMITFCTHCNSKTCTDTLIYDGAQLILSFAGSIMPGSCALTQILTNSHIFASSAHMSIIFTDAFISSIVLCTFYTTVLPSFDEHLALFDSD